MASPLAGILLDGPGYRDGVPIDDQPTLRPATEADWPVVAAIWQRGWGDGHEGHVPEELVAFRTEESFRSRARQRVGDTAVAEVDGVVVGFVMIGDDEVEQVYVARDQRGTGVASALLTEAERLVGTNGHGQAWLAVVPGNSRARRFYERSGWTDEGRIDYPAPTSRGPISIPVHRYVKRIGGARAAGT